MSVGSLYMGKAGHKQSKTSSQRIPCEQCAADHPASDLPDGRASSLNMFAPDMIAAASALRCNRLQPQRPCLN